MDSSKEIQKLVRKEVAAAEEQTYYYPRGEGKLKFNDNTSPFGPSPAVRKSMAMSIAEIIGGIDESAYYPDQNAETLCRLIASNDGVDRNCVVVGAGADEILDILFRVFVNPGDRVCIPTPSYFMYDHLARINAAVIRHAGYGKPPSLPVTDAADSKLYVMSNPNNPLGALFTSAQITALLDALQGVLIVDEAYAEYAGFTVARLTERYRNLVVVRTFSKIYGLTNFRIGYSISPPWIAEQMRKVKNPFNVTTVSQRLACEAIKDQDYVRSIRKLVEHERGKIRDAFMSLGIRVHDSRSNFLLIEPGPMCKRLADALESRGVYFRRISDTDYGDCLRVTVRSPAENDEMLARFSDVLSRL
jgi:histidinol-phosphate aminotransferase